MTTIEAASHGFKFVYRFENEHEADRAREIVHRVAPSLSTVICPIRSLRRHMYELWAGENVKTFCSICRDYHGLEKIHERE